MTQNLKAQVLAEVIANANPAPEELNKIDDIDDRLSELESSFPWVKTYVDGLGQQIKVLEAKLNRIEDGGSNAGKNEFDSLQSAYWNPGDEIAGGGEDVNMEFDMTITDSGKKVEVRKGNVVLDGGDTYWTIVTQKYTPSASEYAFPTVIKVLNSYEAPTIDVLAAYPVPTSDKIYRPLGRLKSNDGGVTWSVDTGIMCRGTIFLTVPLVFS